MNAISKPNIDNIIENVKTALRSGLYTVFDIVQFCANGTNACINWVNTNGSLMVDAETARSTAETSRTTAETTRVSNENTRASNETSRQTNESTRQSQEATRVSNESSRTSTFNGWSAKMNGDNFKLHTDGLEISIPSNVERYNISNVSLLKGEHLVMFVKNLPTQRIEDVINIDCQSGYVSTIDGISKFGVLDFGASPVNLNGDDIDITKSDDYSIELVAYIVSTGQLGILEDLFYDDILVRTTGKTVSNISSDVATKVGNFHLKPNERFVCIVPKDTQTDFYLQSHDTYDDSQEEGSIRIVGNEKIVPFPTSIDAMYETFYLRNLNGTIQSVKIKIEKVTN